MNRLVILILLTALVFLASTAAAIVPLLTPLFAGGAVALGYASGARTAQ